MLKEAGARSLEVLPDSNQCSGYHVRTVGTRRELKVEHHHFELIGGITQVAPFVVQSCALVILY